ncbi:gamma-glutamyltransferase family protein [Nonomuraea sp. K274]|uniref:Gamma-glutamyltransferase family protein n=1 Tax=Nonomuraea cypriaca TaxID=1187855 RepID=A0A931AEU2_9ACTN|nr:gamma-glutamyltransferase family protein [Nonomuraea cypriaca]MBF8190633.1 gamma-glutamyltransferase family protein [Nonomuraea cypriaca]
MVSDPVRRLAERPTIQARHYLASTGHYLATAAATRILDAGGNATDAGVAAGICINVLMPDLTSFGGVAPIVVYDKAREEVKTISGLGTWGKDLTLDGYLERFKGEIPPGPGRSIVPAAADSWLTALRVYGTMSFAEVVAPAIELCERGFPVYPSLNRNIRMYRSGIEPWPSTASIYLKDGDEPEIGSVLIQADLGRTFRRLVEAEERAPGSREDKILAAREEFYQGEIAKRMADFISAEGGFLTAADLAEFSVEIETPVRTNYRGVDVLVCGPWCQGPVVAQTLNILEGFPLAQTHHNSAGYLHLMSQSLNLAFADRDAYYGDPHFVDVPMETLISKEYAAAQRDRISMDRAFDGMPQGGLDLAPARLGPSPEPRTPTVPDPDTSYVCIVDRFGNAFSATPSDGIGTSPIIPGLGLVCSGRGTQSWLDPGHPAVVQAGKRPRLTPNPAMAFKDGRLLMPFGTPGGDMQAQAMVQSFVNIVDFGMDVQEAIEQPRVATYNFPGSGWPHAYRPGLLRLEGRIPAEIADDLTGRGHNVEYWPNWSRIAGNVCAILVDQETGVLSGGADARAEAYAQGW